MNDYVMDLLVPQAHTIRAESIQEAGRLAKGVIQRGETLTSVKPLALWQDHQRAKAQGVQPDAK